MSTDPDWTLLGRFLRGACSPDEAAAVERWEAADPANARLLELAERVWHEAAIDEDDGWSAVQTRIAADSTAAAVRPLRLLPGSTARPRRAWVRAVLAAGAAAAVVATVGTIAWRRTDAGSAAPQPAREYATARGERGELLLVDGTRVWLSVDSRLRVPAGYGTHARDVELEGEAYFRVEHDSTRPFRVHTRGAVSEDLGTEFNVRAYAEDDDVVVTVTSGRVAMHPGASPAPSDTAVELARGQMGRLDRTGRVTVTDDVDLAAALGWRDGGLRFKGRPLVDVLRELERWYDLEIVLEDTALAQVPVTTSLGGRTADQALAILAGALDVRYTRTERTVRLGATSAVP